MKKVPYIFIFLCLISSVGQAQQGIALKSTFDPSDDLHQMFEKIKLVSPSALVAGNNVPQVQTTTEAVVFTSTVPPKNLMGNPFTVTTRFFRRTTTIDKNVEISQGQGRDDTVRMGMALDNQGHVFDQAFLNVSGIPVMVYDRPEDMFVYMQSAAQDGEIELKEWMYARHPNCAQGTCLRWVMKGEDFNRRLVFEEDKNGGMNLQRQMVVSGVDPMDYQKQRHVIEAVKKALKNVKIHIAGEDVVGHTQPVYYWTKEGIPKIGSMRIIDKQILEVIINERPEAYPLLIDPCFIFPPPGWGRLSGGVSIE